VPGQLPLLLGGRGRLRLRGGGAARGLGVDGFFLEYDDERSGGFEPLRFVPKGKLVVLGLVTTKRGELEDKDLLKRRIEDASRFVPLEQLCLSPQCGFSSTVEGNLLTTTSRSPSSA
jgi:5-methyltetrahydropteroyltriglutamate--homocysteine methyltransferase